MWRCDDLQRVIEEEKEALRSHRARDEGRVASAATANIPVTIMVRCTCQRHHRCDAVKETDKLTYRTGQTHLAMVKRTITRGNKIKVL